jgi:aminopeptidase C
MGNIRCTPIKFELDVIQQIADDIVEWYLNNPKEIAYTKFLYTKKYLTKQGKMEYCNSYTFFDNWKQRHQFVAQAIQILQEVQEYRLIDGLVNSPTSSGKHPNGCKFILQSRYNFIPKEEINQTITSIDLSFDEIKKDNKD